VPILVVVDSGIEDFFAEPFKRLTPCTPLTTFSIFLKSSIFHSPFFSRSQELIIEFAAEAVPAPAIAKDTAFATAFDVTKLLASLPLLPIGPLNKDIKSNPKFRPNLPTSPQSSPSLRISAAACAIVPPRPSAAPAILPYTGTKDAASPVASKIKDANSALSVAVN
jgi:hypothetical protein